MANQTENREPNRQEGKQAAFPSAASHFYRGEGVSFAAATGYLAKMGDNAGDSFAGVVTRETDNSDAAAGDERVEVYREGVFEFAFSGTATQADVGSDVYAVDSQTVALAATTTNDVLVGRIVEFVDASTVRVAVRSN